MAKKPETITPPPGSAEAAAADIAAVKGTGVLDDRQAAQQLATTEATTVAAVDIDFAEDAGQSDFGKNDIKLPFIKLIQSLSPEINKKKPDGLVEGAEEGMFIDTVSHELWNGDDGFTFVPFIFTRDVTEWKPNRGGMAAAHGTDESGFANTKRNDKGEDVLPNGNTLLLSYLYYGIRVNERTGETFPAVLPFSKTALKHGRSWNTLISTARIQTKTGPAQPALFYFSYRITSGIESKGENSWYVPEIVRHVRTVELPNGPAIYLEARRLREAFKAGDLKTDDAAKVSGQADPEIPF